MQAPAKRLPRRCKSGRILQAPMAQSGRRIRLKSVTSAGSRPARSTNKHEWWNGIHAGFRNQCQEWIESSSLSSCTKRRWRNGKRSGLKPHTRIACCWFDSSTTYQGRLLRPAADTVLKTVGWVTIRDRHLSLPPYGFRSLEVKALACEAEEAGALPVDHPKICERSIKANAPPCQGGLCGFESRRSRHIGM